MKNLLAIIFVFFCGNLFSQSIQPRFVSEQITHFNANPSYHERSSYADTWAWGTAVMSNGTNATWFAFTNTDAYFQLRFNCLLSGEEIGLIEPKKDELQRNYSSFNEKGLGWIGISNDWAMGRNEKLFVAYKKPRNVYNKKAVVPMYLVKLMQTGAFKNLKVEGYL